MWSHLFDHEQTVLLLAPYVPRNWNNWNLELVDHTFAHIGHMVVIRMLTIYPMQGLRAMLLKELLVNGGPETSNLKPGLFKST